MAKPNPYAVERRRRREYAINRAIPEEELLRVPRELISILMSIPEADRLAYFRGWERLVRAPWQERHESAFYGRESWAKSFSAAIRLAQAVWAEWPPQEPEEE